jgi:predicted NUDIX family NTP pyrophosphohydrolase
MPGKSAGILLYRIGRVPEYFLVHPGGPYWAAKDEGAWSIPKGEFGDEDPLKAARREFLEETGSSIDGTFLPLAPVRLKSGKTVVPFAVEGDIDADNIRSNSCQIEWPPRSGRKMEIPEVDRGGWFTYEEAIKKINSGQVPFIEELHRKIAKGKNIPDLK